MNNAIALIGNPNAGKTTLFNALSGRSSRVGNYPGVTMELSSGTVERDGKRVTVIDLPGTYSMAPASDDERVTTDLLWAKESSAPQIGHIFVVADAMHLERHAYLLAQLHDLNASFSLVLTMTDSIDAANLSIDTRELSSRLGCAVLRGSGHRPSEVESVKDHMVSLPLDGKAIELTEPPTWLARLSGKAGSSQAEDIERRSADVERFRLKAKNLVTDVLSGPLEGTQEEKATDRIDDVVLHPVLGPLLFILLFGLVFQALFTWSGPLMDAIDAAVSWLGELCVRALPEQMELLRSLVGDGIFAGVGGVLVFVPQIAILFFALALLEDSGLLARVAFLLDRLMSGVGLHGKAFVPFVSGFACAVPAIMATRAISDRHERFTTIMVTPLISCSARLPVYTLIVATLFSGSTGVLGIQTGTLIMFGAYVLSVAAALVIAFVLKRTLLKGPPSSLVLELPVYRRPQIMQAVRIAGRKSWLFIKDAGTIIFAITIILWAFFTFPQDPSAPSREAAAVESIDPGDGEALRDAAAKQAAISLEYSAAGRLGKFIEPAIAPLGFDWKMGVGLIASFAAREVFVSSMGVVYGLGDGQDEGSSDLKSTLNSQTYDDGRKIYTPLTGISLIVFFVLAMQCMSTLAATRRETRSWRWPVFQFVYMTALAYVGSLLTYQGGLALGFT